MADTAIVDATLTDEAPRFARTARAVAGVDVRADPSAIVVTAPVGARAHTAPLPLDRLAAHRDPLRRRALAIADLTALCLAEALVAITVPFGASASEWSLIAFLPLWVALNAMLSLYDRDTHIINKSTVDELPMIALSVSLGTGALFLFGPVIPGVELAREQCIAFLFAAMATTPALRWAARTAIRVNIAHERCLIVGSGPAAACVARKLRTHAEYGTTVVGYVDSPPDELTVTMAGHVPYLGDEDQFVEVCCRHDIERVLIAFSDLGEERLLDMVRACKRMGIKITVIPRLYEIMGRGVQIDQVEGLGLISLRGLSRSRTALGAKRALDVVGAFAGLVVGAPLLLAIAGFVKLTSKGPVLFQQPRIGRGGKPFTMLKFRTMVDGADAMKEQLAHLNEMAGGPMFKISDDPRVTRIGRLLRTSSLDELPQLLNVLRGEMSLVGPRPLVPSESDQVLGWHRARLDLTPGLTGPWQVLGRNAIPFEEMIELDYMYVAEWSLWNDLRILAKTLAVLIWRTGR